MNNGTIRAFVSSTYVDLIAHRAAVRKVLEMMSIPNFAMEIYVSDEREPLEKCLADVRESNVYIGIFAHRYGHIPAGQTKSITELEFREAGIAGIDRLLFLLADGVPWNPQHLDSFTKENGAGDRIRAFREELGQTKTVSFFSTPEDLAAKVAASVHAWCGAFSRQSSKVLTTDFAVAKAPALSEYLQFCQSDMEDFRAHYVPLDGRITKIQAQPPAFGISGLWPPAFRVLANNSADAANTRMDQGQIDSLLLSEAKGKRVLLSAEAGAGKTVTLRWLRLQLVKQLMASQKGQVPLYINLPEWPTSIDDFRSLIVHERTVCGCPIVPDGNLFLLLDGLDEVNPERRLSYISKMTSWLDAHPEVSCVIALRKSSSRESYPITASVLEIQPLERAQIEQFISKRLNEKRYKELLTRLFPKPGKADHSSQLSFLARSPFNLALVCAVFSSFDGELPTSLGRLLAHLFQALYQRELDIAPATGQTAELFLEELGKLAFDLFGPHTKTVMYVDWIRKRLSDAHQLDRMQRLGAAMGLLKVTKNARVYSFSHSIYQRYFLVEYIRTHDKAFQEFLAIVAESAVADFPENLLETVHLMLDLVEPNQLLRSISHHNPCLAFTIINQLKTRPSLDVGTSEILVTQLRQFFDNWRTDQFVIERLIRNAVDVFPEHSSLLLVSQNPSFRRTAIRVLAEMPTWQSVRIVLIGLKDKNRAVRREARELLRMFAQKTEDILTLVQEALSSLSLPERRDIAAIALDAVGFEHISLANKLVELGELGFATISRPKRIGDSKHEPPDDDAINARQLIDLLFDARDKVLEARTMQRTPGADANLTQSSESELDQALSPLVPLQSVGETHSSIFESERVDELIYDLGRVEADAAVEVVRKLILMGNTVCGPLLDVLHSENSKLRRRVPRVLGALRYKPAIPNLIELLDDPFERVVYHAIRALALMKEPSTIWIFEEFVHRKHPTTAMHALRGLRFIGGQDAAQVSLRFLNDFRPDVRYEAVLNVETLDPTIFAKNVSAFLRDVDGRIRRRALFWLIEQSPLEGFRTTLELLRSNNGNTEPLLASMVKIILGANGRLVAKRESMQGRFDTPTRDAIIDYSIGNWKYICDCFVAAIASETDHAKRKNIAVVFYRFLEWNSTFDKFVGATPSQEILIND